MTTNIEAAKKLLKKAIATGDDELIALANELLGDNTDETEAESETEVEVKPKRGRPSKKVVKVQGKKIAKRKPGGPVSFTGNKFNPADFADKFKDDTESFDKLVKFDVSERREARDDIEVKCSRCNRTEVLPGSYAGFFGETRYYVCNKCGSPK